MFGRRIKVLSLFFIDEVARYKKYDETGCPQNGSYADIFEEEYRNIIENMKYGPGDEKYRDYIEMIPVEKTHAGYFSIDRKGHVVDSKGKGKEMMSDDQDAYDLIMKNKELLLECDPKQSPVRFIFSHSALREGWDNPNVFQICTLKNGGSEVRKRQEVGRGLRLCVNGDGQRMDRSFLGQDVHRVNTLTVIASESYESFVKGLQSEIAEDVFGKQSRKADVCRDIEVIIPENARSRRVELKVDQEKLNGEEFSALWSNICLKSTYTVNFDTEKLVEDAVKILNRELHIQDRAEKENSDRNIEQSRKFCFSTVSRKSGRIYRSGRKIDLKCERNSDFGKYHISYVRRKIYKRYFYTADDSGKTGSGRNESREAFV